LEYNIRARANESISLDQATKIIDQFIVDLSSAVAHLPNVRSLAEVPLPGRSL